MFKEEFNSEEIIKELKENRMNKAIKYIKYLQKELETERNATKKFSSELIKIQDELNDINDRINKLEEA